MMNRRFMKPAQTKRAWRGLCGGRVFLPIPVVLCATPLFFYLFIACAFPNLAPSPFPLSRHRTIATFPRESVDTHLQTVRQLSPGAHAALKANIPLPTMPSNVDSLFKQVDAAGGSTAPSHHTGLDNRDGSAATGAAAGGIAASAGTPATGVAAGRPLRVEEMVFKVEEHGYQCLVYRHKARKVTPQPTGDVTWVTQMTTDRLGIFKTMLERWSGPVSVALYSQDVARDVKDIEPFLDRVDFHIVGASQGLYPVNTLRNVALNNARTDFVILADVDFVPAEGSYEAAKAFVADLIAGGRHAEKKVYVLPAFEIDGADQTVPKDFEALQKMGPRIHQVHIDKGRDIAHKYTDYARWMRATSPYKAAYQFPYEPYVLAPRFIPRYDVRFFGYGNDKASHNYELNAAGFEFFVLPRQFVVHVSHPQGSWVQQSFIDPKDRLSRTLTTFLQDCDRRYAMTRQQQTPKVFPAYESLYACMYVCIYTCIDIYMYVYIYVYICCIYIHTYIHT